MITGSEIYQALAKIGVDNWVSLRRDKNYVCAKREWYAGVFLQKWKRVLVVNDLTEWKEEVWDCEDVSDLCMVTVKLDHRRYYQGPPAGIAFGGWGYVPDWSYSEQNPQGKGHWINMAVVSEAPIEFAWFEPQIPPDGVDPVGLITLSEKEIRSCTSDVLLPARRS